VSAGLLVGVDVGTQSVKAGLFAADGSTLAEAARPLALHRRGPNHVEQDPEDFVAGVTATIASCVADAGCGPGDVAGIGLAGQMAGILGVGADGRAVTPYDSWLDSRCGGEVEEIAARLGDEVVERTGCTPMVAHAPKMLWRLRNRPDEYARVERFVVPSAYIAGRLAGLRGADAHVDWTHLHFSGLADAAASSWSPELAAAIGLDPGRLPRIVAPTEAVGGLTPSAASDCGLAEGIPVAAGLGDTAAGILGAGVVAPGQLLDTAGTASVLAVAVPEFRPDTAGRMLIAMRGAVPGQWVSLSYLAGGDLLRWLPRALAGVPAGDDSALATLLAEAARAEAGRLLFVPHLGGRILPPAPSARGAWLGLDLADGRGDLVRAVLESVAFEYEGYLDEARGLFTELSPSEVRVIGGGAENALWNRIKASVLGLPYVRLRRESFSCWGAALVGGAAAGVVPDLAAAALRTTAVEESIEPDPDLHATYAALLPDYRAAVETVLSRTAPAEAVCL